MRRTSQQGFRKGAATKLAAAVLDATKTQFPKKVVATSALSWIKKHIWQSFLISAMAEHLKNSFQHVNCGVCAARAVGTVREMSLEVTFTVGAR